MYFDLTKVDWKYVITALIAIYGAILSTINLINNVKNNKSFIEVTTTWGMITGDEKTKLFITASNPSSRTVTLSSMGFILPNKKYLIFTYPESNVSFPYEVQTGKNCMVWCDIYDIAVQLKKQNYEGDINLIGFYKDQLGKEYKSKKMNVNINTMLQG